MRQSISAVSPRILMEANGMYWERRSPEGQGVHFIGPYMKGWWLPVARANGNLWRVYKRIDSDSELGSARMAPWRQVGAPGMAHLVGVQHSSLLAGLGCVFGFFWGRVVGGDAGHEEVTTEQSGEGSHLKTADLGSGWPSLRLQACHLGISSWLQHRPCSGLRDRSGFTQLNLGDKEEMPSKTGHHRAIYLVCHQAEAQ